MGIGAFPQSLDYNSNIESPSMSDERQTLEGLGYMLGRRQPGFCMAFITLASGFRLTLFVHPAWALVFSSHRVIQSLNIYLMCTSVAILGCVWLMGQGCTCLHLCDDLWFLFQSPVFLFEGGVQT